MKLNRHSLIASFVLIASCCAGGAAARDYDFGLHVYPNPFFPGFDYDGKNATVWFGIRSGGTASVRVYDLEGVLVRTLSEGQKVGPGEHEIPWDGRGDDGNLVAPGPYVVVLELNILGESYRDTFVAVAYR